MVRHLSIVDGRRAFGASAASYDNARPPYPERIYEVLRERCGLKAGTRTFEIGPGTGLATRPLLAAGAAPLVAVEPDERLAAVLRQKTPDAALEVVPVPFEDAVLPAGGFDLGVSATAFHWLEQRPALAKVATLLRPGGAWAVWWNVFGDPDRADPFHDATQPLLSDLSDNAQHPFGLDTAGRIADLEAAGAFTDIVSEVVRWTLVLNPAQVRALYATYSHLSVLEEGERNRILDGLFGIAASPPFGGRVERNMTTAIYTARRR